MPGPLHRAVETMIRVVPEPVQTAVIDTTLARSAGRVLAPGQRGDAATTLERATVRRERREPNVDGPLERRRKSAAVARTAAGADRAGHPADIDLSQDAIEPERREPVGQQRRARSDECRQASTDVGAGGVEPDWTHSPVGLIDRGQRQGSIAFHATVGP